MPTPAIPLTPATPGRPAGGSTDLDAGAMTTVDLSAGTEAYTALKGAGTVLGESSTFVNAAVHGLPDAGLDCYSNLQSIGVADGHVLHIRLEIGTLPTETPNGNALLGICVSPDPSLASGEGYIMAIAQTNTPSLKSSNIIIRPGSNWSPSTPVFTGAPVILDAFFIFSGTSLSNAGGTVVGDTTGGRVAYQTTAAAGTYSDIHIGIIGGQANASPSGVVTWGDVVLSYEWVA